MVLFGVLLWGVMPCGVVGCAAKWRCSVGHAPGVMLWSEVLWGVELQGLML